MTEGKRGMKTVFTFLAVSIMMVIPVSAEIETTSWGGAAEIFYDNGFMHMLKKHPDGGVSLFNMDLVENDSPGPPESAQKVSQPMSSGEKTEPARYCISIIRGHMMFRSLFF